ncbi:MAG TPA: acyltransferase domain-containing protein, partial [Polyangiales bacterium]|nr:acyltransferase domain-containing protein [Polyangiales bacterium]
MTFDPLATLITQLVGQQLGREPSTLSEHVRFRELGIDSAMGVRIVAELSSKLGRTLVPTLLWQYPTIARLAQFLSAEERGEKPAGGKQWASSRNDRASGSESIAIIGLGCRLPGGIESPDALWQALASGRDCIREVPPERWDAERWFDEDVSAPGKMSTRWGGFLDAVDQFDAGFFGISPREAIQMDPQQRLFLETAWDSLENARLVPVDLQGTSTGVFVGAMWGQYQLVVGDGAEHIDQHSAVGWDSSIISGRLSYALGLQGPSLTVNTASSSSLVAVHLACASLRMAECELALAGGVNLMLTPHATVQMSKVGTMNPRGQCRAFDAQAEGYVRGEGCGVVVLKRLSEAVADGDRIYAVIRGSAVNNDGFSNGLTAPNPAAQRAVLRSAWSGAEVAPSSVAYVETHGPGTILGDPIEAQALGDVFAPERLEALRIGSVKTNLGHLEAAAGMAGLLKVALALHRGAIPPNLHFEAPNPHIDFEALKLRVASHLEGFGRAPVRYAGVSSFGFGGTNAHLALSEAPGRTLRAIALASETKAGLRSEAKTLADELMAVETDARLAALATRQHGSGAVRATLLGKDAAELAEGLRKLARGRAEIEKVSKGARKRLFVFGGQGGQWAGMARDLLTANTYFQSAIRSCDEALAPLTGWSVRRALATLESGTPLTAARDVQPLLFAVQVSLARTLMHWGLMPDAVMGQSVGEVAAAVVCGALSLADGARVVVAQSRLVAERAKRGGAMLMAELSSDEAQSLLASHPCVAIAVHLAPRQLVFSGRSDALDVLARQLEERGLRTHRILIDCASHSSEMDPILPELGLALDGLRSRVPTIPMWSTVDSDWVGAGRLLGAAYWCDNLRAPVRLQQAVESLQQVGFATFIEVGPHPVLKSAVVATLEARAARDTRYFASCWRAEPAGDGLLELAAACWREGAPIQWDAIAATSQPASPEPSVARAGATQDAVLLVSGRDERALRAQAARLATWLSAHPEESLLDVAYTLALHRTQFEARASIPVESVSGAIDALQDVSRGVTPARVVLGRAQPRKKVVFVFPGQGGQWLRMGRALLRESEAFADTITACDAALQPWTGWSVLELLRGDADAEARFERIAVVQPALFAVSLGLAEVWRTFGVTPDAVVGHSQGEVVAAVLAGALTLEAGAQVVAIRSRALSARSGQGAMVAVELPEHEMARVLDGYGARLSIAVVNGPSSIVVSGELEAAEALIAELDARGVYSRRINADVASHSSQMDALLPGLQADLSGLMPRPAELPFYSTAKGRLLRPEEPLDAEYWCRNLRDAVRLDRALEALQRDGYGVFIEVSPHPVLSATLADVCEPQGGVVVATLQRERGGLSQIHARLGELHAHGYAVAWPRVFAGSETRTADLPTYAFQRERYWLGDKPRQASTRAPDPSDVRVRWSSLSRSEREPLAFELVRGELAQILGHQDAATLPSELPFKKLGLDSLGAMELRRRLLRLLGAELTVAEVFGANIASLSAQLADAIEHVTVAIGEPIQPTLPEDPHAPFPLTPMQEAYWVGRQLGPQVGFHYYREVELRGMDLPRLEAAWRKVIERHDALRIVFTSDGTQRLLAEVPQYVLPVEDLRGLDEHARSQRLEQVRAQLSAARRAVDVWPLFEFRALLLPDDQVRLCLDFDLLCLDGASLSIVTDDWRLVYEDPEILLPALLPRGFEAVVRAGISARSSERYRRDLDYWIRRRPSFEVLPQLPLARSPGALETCRNVRYRAGLNAAAWQQLCAQARAHGITPTMTLCTAFAEVLRRWSAGAPFLLNLTNFTRPPLDANIYKLAGDFTNLLFLECGYEPGSSFASSSAVLQEQLHAHLEHGSVDGVEILRAWRQAGTDVNVPVVFTSLLGLPGPALSFGRDLWLGEQVFALSQTPQVWLDCLVTEVEGELQCVWDVVDGLFPAGMIEDMLAAYQGRLEALARDPAAWSDAWPELRPERECARIAAVNATSTALTPQTLHGLFAEQA